MIRIAIVEDDEAYAENLLTLVSRYQQEKKQELTADRFADAESFLSHHPEIFDIVFFDIELPGESGMEAAKAFRELSKSSVVVFVTNMSQFAVEGYKVDALDYLLKPVTYPEFSTLLTRILKILVRRDLPALSVKTKDGVIVLKLNEIIYLQVRDHALIYHTEKGDYSTWATLKESEGPLLAHGFFRVSNQVLLNLRHVENIQGTTIVLSNGDHLEISLSKLPEFTQLLVESRVA